MNDLIILGTGIHGGEMAEIVERGNRRSQTWNLLGFLTEEQEQVGQQFNGYAILGTREAIDRYPQAFFVHEYQWTRKRETPVERLATIIDPSSTISRSAYIGHGTVIFPNCYVGINARIGDMVFVLPGAIINHDTIIDDLVTITSGVSLAGSVHVEEGCYIGQAASVRQLLTIGKGSMIGMGSVVVRSVSPNSVMMGNPARRVRDHMPVVNEASRASEGAPRTRRDE